jgi:hypothetical protein
MQNCDPPAIDLDVIEISGATLAAIAAAAKPDKPLSDETLEALRGWLADALAGAVRWAGATPLTKDDVDALETAYRAFKIAIGKLKDRNQPPPSIPVDENGHTAWDRWIFGRRDFPAKRGRDDGRDWWLIAQLLALYETVSGKRASSASDSSPAIRFLDSALSSLADLVPEKHWPRFAPPNAETLKKQMPFMRAKSIPVAARRLATVMAADRA